MPNYRVRPGKRHGSHKQYGPGDIVEMSEFEAATLLDKLELVGDEMPKDRTDELLKDLDPDARATLKGPDLSRMKVDDILAQIDAGTLDAAVALKAEETSSRPRVTLIDTLKERLGGGAE
jgi:hypothetical protein